MTAIETVNITKLTDIIMELLIECTNIMIIARIDFYQIRIIALISSS